MNSKETKLKILAQAIYEIRILLSHHVGKLEENSPESLSAHLAYALHNDALAIIEDRPEDFNVESTIERISIVAEVDQKLSNRFHELVIEQ